MIERDEDTFSALKAVAEDINLSSRICLLIMLAMFIAWLSGDFAGILASIFGVVVMIAMIEDKRVAIAKRNLKDTIKVCERLHQVNS